MRITVFLLVSEALYIAPVMEYDETKVGIGPTKQNGDLPFDERDRMWKYFFELI